MLNGSLPRALHPQTNDRILPHPCWAKPPIPRAEPPVLGAHNEWGQPKISAHLGMAKLHFPSHHLCTHSGLLHSRIAVLMPPPQVLEQVPKGLQVPQAPSVTGASRSLGTHIPNLQCCRNERHGKGGIVLLCIMSDQHNKTRPHLFLRHTQWFCDQIKVSCFIFCLSTPYFNFSVPLNGKVKARCWVRGMIYGMKTENNSNHWIFPVYWCWAAQQSSQHWLFKKLLYLIYCRAAETLLCQGRRKAMRKNIRENSNLPTGTQNRKLPNPKGK